MLFGQTGFARYTEGATTFTATTYKRAEDNVVAIVEPATFVKVIRAGARDAEGNLPPEVWREVETYPIDDGREIEKYQNGLGIGENGAPAYTLDCAQQASVAQVFVKSKRAQNDQDDETWKTDAPHPTVNQFDQGDSRAVAAVVSPTLTAVNMDSRLPQSEESQRIVGAVHGVTGTVRRLTPLECERLQGFPDGWTEGQADSHRYKQMGNAVAVPVVEWIMQGIVEVMNDQC